MKFRHYKRVISIALILMSLTIMFYPVDPARADQTVPVYTLFQINENSTYDYSLNISSDNYISNSDIWQEVRQWLNIEGKLSSSELPPSSYQIDYNRPGGGLELKSIFMLPPSFFMQGVSECWVRLPIEDYDGPLNVRIDMLYSQYDITSYQFIYNHTFPNTGIEKYYSTPWGYSNDLKVKAYNYNGYNYQFMYIKIKAPLYSDIPYMLTLDTGNIKPKVLFTQGDNGLNGFNWAGINGINVDVSLSIDILGVYGMGDSITGLYVPPQTYIEFTIHTGSLVNELDNITVFIPMALTFYGWAWFNSTFDKRFILPYYNEYPQGAFINRGNYSYIFFSEQFAVYPLIGHTFDTIRVKMYFETENYLYLKDQYWPYGSPRSEYIPKLNTSGHTDQLTDFTLTYDNYDGKSYKSINAFSVWYGVNVGGLWDNTIIPTKIEYQYTYTLTYVNYEERPTLNKASIYYGFYRLGEYSYKALSFTWQKIRGAARIIYDQIPDNYKDRLERTGERFKDFSNAFIEASNWILENVIDFATGVFTVGIQAYEIIEDNIPAMQNILGLLLRVIRGLEIITTFTAILYTIYKITNTMRIISTGGIEAGLNYASEITIFTRMGRLISSIAGAVR